MGQNDDMDKCYFWDIETSTITLDYGEEIQITYLSNVVGMNCVTGEIISSEFFRTIEETIDYFKTLHNVIVWCHNLDYELTFLLRDIEGTALPSDKIGIYDNTVQEIILRDKNSPLSIKLCELPNITFRDSYALFNTSVEVLGDKIGLKKLDYDYKKIRLPWTELEQHDYDYNERDNIIVAKSIYNYMIENNYQVDEIPLTFTSQVRRARRKYISTNFGAKAINKFYFDRQNYYDDFVFFEDLQKVYQGGLTASIMKNTNNFIDDNNTSGVVGVDIKSSYPNQMCTRKFPFFSKKDSISLYGDLADRYYKIGCFKGCIGMFKFTNIKVKNDNYILPISTSQLRKGDFSNDTKLFNGKLISASEIILPCTNIDINVINMVYEYDSLECLSIHATSKERFLRIEEVSFLLDNFLIKESKKGNTANAKLIINSMYGVKVSNPVKDNYIIQDGEIEVEKYFNHTLDDRCKIYNNYLDTQPLFGGSIDLYSDGVFITSYARMQLVEKVVEIVNKGGKVVYCDTDSIKFYCDTKEELQTLVNGIIISNTFKIERNKKLSRFKQFRKLKNLNDEEYNLICRLGIWELEDKIDNNLIAPHKLFITYGAKKYGYINYFDEIKTTIAGCNKKNVPVVIENFSKLNNISKVEGMKYILSPGTTFDESASGRTTAQKEKRSREELNHATYQGRRINQYGGIIIKDTTYTLNVSLNDSKILKILTDKIELFKINIKGEIYFEQIS